MVDRSVEVKLKADISNFQRGFRTATRDAVGLEGALATLDGRLASVQHSQDSATDSQTALNRSWNNGSKTLGQYQGQMNSTQASLGILAKRTSGLGKETSTLGDTTKKAATEVERLGAQLTVQQRKLDTEKAALRGMRAELRGATGNTTSLTSAISKQEKVVTRHAETVHRTESAITGFTTAAEDADHALGDLGNEVDTLGKRSTTSSKEIDKLSGRLSIWRDLALTIGPGLVPLVAGSIPAITGLTAGLGAAAGAFGVTLLAVHGLGAGLKALDAYQLEPTAANLQKMQDEMKKLGPAGAEFVHFLDGLEPKLTALQQVARAGLFPGVEAGIEDLLTRLPQVKMIVGEIATSLGGVAADAGKNLGGPKFDAFFNYVQRTAGPTLEAFAQATGNVAEGLANMLIAFDPVSQSFTAGLLHMSQAFAQWSRSLDTNQGFQSFLQYVQQSGPQVVHLIGSLVSALAGIAEAAAPVGHVVLPVLTEFVQVIGDIASSDLGGPIVAMAAGFVALNRTLSITSGLVGSVSKGLATANPWVLAAVVTVGSIEDVVHANDDLNTAITSAQAALDSADTSKMRAQLKLLNDQISQTNYDNSPTSFLDHPTKLLGGIGVAKAVFSQVDQLLGGTSDKANALHDALQASIWVNPFLSNVKGAGDALSSELVGPLGMSASAFHQAALGADAFTKSLNKVNDVLSHRSDFRAYQQSIDDATAALKTNGKTLDANTQKGRDNGSALDAIAQQSLTYAGTLKGVARLDFLNNARKQLVQTATAFGMTTPKAQALADRLHLLAKTPPVKPQVTLDDSQFLSRHHMITQDMSTLGNMHANPFVDLFTSPFDAGKNHVDSGLSALDHAQANPHVNVDTGSASSELHGIQAQVDNLHGKTIDINVRHLGQALPASAYGNIFHFANGDIANAHQPQLAGPGPVRVWREPETQGEAYIPLANDNRRPRARAILGQTAGLMGGQVTWHAKGSTTDPRGMAPSSNPWGGFLHETGEVTKGLKGLKDRLHDAQHALKDQQHALEQQQAQLQRMQAYRDSVSGSLSSPVFGNGLAGFNLAATANRNDNRAALAALKKARSKGLNGPLFAALAASGDLNAIEQFAGLGRGQIRKEELLYGSSIRSDNALAAYATTKKFGETIADQQDTIKHLDKTIRDLNHAINHLEHRVERGARKGTHDGHKDQNRGTTTRTRTGR